VSSGQNNSSKTLDNSFKKLLGNEIGTQFDIRDRQFAYYNNGAVFDVSSWSERDMKTMILRDGQAAALEL
jgi:hypothetical protein